MAELSKQSRHIFLLAIIGEELGDIPLVGFFGNGEISRGQLYGYTGVLSVFL